MGAACEPGFASLLRQYRKAAGLSQEELAERAQLSRRGVSDLERGATNAPRRDTVELLADALDLSDAERAHFHAAARRGQGAPAAPRARASVAQSVPLPPPFVGREDELAHIARFLAGEEAPMLLLAGEPGMGKTRLLREAVRLASVDGWAVLEGGCMPGSKRESFAPVAEALARRCAKLTPAQLRASLRGCAWLARLLPELAESGVAPLPQWTLPQEQERRLIFAAVARFLGNVAGPAGILLALDDLQWAGEDALDLLNALMRAQPERPVRVVGVYRDTDVRPQDPLGTLIVSLARDGALAQRKITPLPRADAGSLLNALLDGADEIKDAAVVERVLQRSGGVPFFLVSCARGLRTGALSGTVEDVPWDAAQSVRLRMATLPEAAQLLMGVASVVGRIASRALLAEVMERAEEETLTLAEAVCETRLMREEGPDAYQFTHDIIRSVAYDGLSAGRRRLLHQRIADALMRGVSGGAAHEGIAEHYEQAGDTAKAIAQLERAAAQAHSAGAFLDARAYMERAIALVGEDERMRLYEEMGDYVAIGEAAVMAYQQALERWRRQRERQANAEARDTLTGARLLRKLFLCIRYSGSAMRTPPLPEELQRLIIEGRQLAEAAGDEYERWRVDVNELLFHLWWREVYPMTTDEAERWRARALSAATYFEARGDWVAFSQALEGCAQASYVLNGPDVAEAALRRALAVPALPLWERSRALDSLTDLCFDRGDYEGCSAIARAELARRAPGQPLLHLVGMMSSVGVNASWSGRWSEIGEIVDLMLEAWEQAQYSPNVINMLGGFISSFLVARAREDWSVLDTVKPALDQIFEFEWRKEDHALVNAVRDDDPGKLDLACYLCGRPRPVAETLRFLSEHDIQAPESLIEGARVIARRTHVNALERVILVAEALASGDDARLAATIEGAEAHGLIPHAARMRIVLAQRTGDRAMLERTRVTLERIGDRLFLRKLEAVAAEMSSGGSDAAPQMG